MKNQKMKMIIILIIVCFIFVSCATAKQIPYNATQEQIQKINAENIAATATNTCILALIQILSIVFSVLAVANIY